MVSKVRPQAPLPATVSSGGPGRPARAVEGKPAAGAAEKYWGAAVQGVRDVHDLYELLRDNPTAERLGPGLTRTIPVVPRPDAKLLYVDPKALRDLGLHIGTYGRLTQDEERALAQSFAVRPARAGEDATHDVVATRYQDLSRGQGFGAVQGDGRAGILGKPLSIQIAQKSKGTKTELVNLRVKGVPTGLAPVGTPKGDGHGTGLLSELNALADTIVGSYLGRNGVDATRAPAVASVDEQYKYYFVLGGEKVPFTSRVGFQLLAGSFDRLAHLQAADGDPQVLRGLLDDVGVQVAAELGRKHPLGHAALYMWLVDRQAREQADLWFARAMHGSTTYDNVGLRDGIDMSTVAVVDRAHPTYRPIDHISQGMGKEAEEVMGFMMGGELTRFFKEAATPEEQAKLATIDPGRLAFSSWWRRMGANAVHHLGFDDDTVRTLCKHDRGAVFTFLDTMKNVAERQVIGAQHQMSKDDVVSDPARYDAFAAMAILVPTIESGLPEAQQIDRVLAALQPIAPDAAADRAAAKELLDAARPVVAAGLRGVAGDVKQAKVEIVADQAQRVNAPVVEFAFSAVRNWTAAKLDAVHAGTLSQERLRGEVGALVRRNIRRGPEAADAVAMGVRHDDRPRENTGRIELSRVEENGVLLQELSDGARDLVRFSLATDPLSTGDLGRYRMRCSLDGGATFQTLSPTRIERGEAVFDVLVTKAPTAITASFFDVSDPTKTFDQDGLGFGAGHLPVLASLAVDAELGAYADRHGLRRSGTSESRRRAVPGYAKDDVARAAIDKTSLSTGKDAAAVARWLQAHNDARPVGDPYRLADGSLARAAFQGGDTVAVVAGPHGAHAVPPLLYDVVEPFILDLGPPLGEARTDAQGRTAQDFVRGRATFTPKDGARVVITRSV